MNTHSETKIAPQGLQKTCLDIPSENGCSLSPFSCFKNIAGAHSGRHQ